MEASSPYLYCLWDMQYWIFPMRLKEHANSYVEASQTQVWPSWWNSRPTIVGRGFVWGMTWMVGRTRPWQGLTSSQYTSARSVVVETILDNNTMNKEVLAGFGVVAVIRLFSSLWKLGSSLPKQSKCFGLLKGSQIYKPSGCAVVVGGSSKQDIWH